jgi:serine/threonine protein phosphatase 1
MIRSLLQAVFGREAPPATAAGPIRLAAAERPEVIYAIGDVHGCLDALRALEALIVANATDVAGEKWIVMLGDYIDRGPSSAQVLDHLLAPPPEGFKRVCLRGNHEQSLLNALGDTAMIDRWLEFGGDQTMISYGVGAAGLETLRRGRANSRLQLLAAHIPEEHLKFLRELSSILTVPGYVFVHAGLRPGVAIDAQTDRDMLWIRGEFLDADHDFGVVVVHGHTPMAEPFLSERRIGIDTGCFMTGRLTGVRVDGTGVRVVGVGRL